MQNPHVRIAKAISLKKKTKNKTKQKKKKKKDIAVKMFKTVKEQLFTDPKQIFADKFTARECVISSFMETCKN